MKLINISYNEFFTLQEDRSLFYRRTTDGSIIKLFDTWEPCDRLNSMDNIDIASHDVEYTQVEMHANAVRALSIIPGYVD